MAVFHTETTLGLLRIEVNEGGALVITSDVSTANGRESNSVDLAVVEPPGAKTPGHYSLIVDGKSHELIVQHEGDRWRLFVGPDQVETELLTEREWRLRRAIPNAVAQPGASQVRAPMPGLVKAVLVSNGDQVVKGQRLIVLEAMKMENDITANRDGSITDLGVSTGTVVEGGAIILRIT